MTNNNSQRWTAEQLDAINLRDTNLLVSAAAGSGKTAVLVQRIVEIITNPQKMVDIDKLLVVTFTRAAASEMKNRITEALSKRLQQINDSQSKEESLEERANLRRQMTLLNKANITTIHSFCLGVVRKNFQVLGINPDFKILDEATSKIMKSEVIDELFEKKYALATSEEADEEDKRFLELVECYGSKYDDEPLKELVFEIYNFIQGRPYSKQWLEQSCDMFDIKDEQDFLENPWVLTLTEKLKTELDYLNNKLEEARELAIEGENPNYLETIESDLSGIKSLLQLNSWEAYYKAMESIKFDRLKRSSPGADEILKEQVKDIRDAVKASIEKIKEKLFFNDMDTVIKDLKAMSVILKALSKLTIEFSENFRGVKTENGFVDFNDLEQYAFRILVKTDDDYQLNGNMALEPTLCALEYKDYFEEILIDEYQDTNSIQEAILTSIAKDSPSNLFMVGDVKQSIYKFRLAEPELFLNKYNTYGKKEENNPYGTKINLEKNFRSRKEILDGVNFIFKQIMSKDIGDIDYDESVSLKLGLEKKDENEGSEYSIELDLIDLKDDGDDQEVPSDEESESETYNEALEINLEELTKTQIEARFIIKKIKELMSEDKGITIFDAKNKVNRRLKYSDIVILLRSTANVSQVLLEEMLNSDVPAYAEAQGGYFDSIEIKTAINMLKIIDNPLQNIPLIAILRSPIVGLTSDELAKIRASGNEENFYELITNILKTEIASEDEENLSLKSKLLEFNKKLESLRDRACSLGIDELLWILYNETDYYSFVGALLDGEKRQSNLRLLFYKAQDFERSDNKGLFNFIRYIEKLDKKIGGTDMDSAKIVGENEDVVRVMSIHKSKGLEFPVVFLSQAGKKFNKREYNNTLIFHNTLGFGVTFIDSETRIKYDTLSKEAVKYRKEFENMSEEMRILYVGMTRAREKLIITSTVADLSKKVEAWSKLLSATDEKLPLSYVKNAQSLLDWVGMSIIRHEAAKNLREYKKEGIYGSVNILSDPSKWEIKLLTKNDINETHSEDESIKKRREQIEAIDISKVYYNEFNDELLKRLHFHYKDEWHSKIPAKVSVSEIKAMHAEYEKDISDGSLSLFNNVEEAPRPAFLENKKGLNATERGTLIHFVMRHIDFNFNTLAEINNKLDKMVADELITNEQRDYVSCEKILEFIKSPLGERIRISQNVFREMPFNLLMNENEIFGTNVEEPCNIMVQGIIDCYFIEDNQAVLVDYKTDYIGSDEDITKIKDRYKKQIEIYEKAIKEILKINVKNKYLYLFSKNILVEY